MINFSDVLERVKKIKGLEHDYQLADILGISQENFSQKKRRRTLLPLLLPIAIEEKVDLNWLLKGSDPNCQNEKGASGRDFKKIKEERREYSAGAAATISFLVEKNKELESRIASLEQKIKDLGNG